MRECFDNCKRILSFVREGAAEGSPQGLYSDRRADPSLGKSGQEFAPQAGNSLKHRINPLCLCLAGHSASSSTIDFASSTAVQRHASPAAGEEQHPLRDMGARPAAR